MIECGATYLPIAPTNSLPLRRAPVCAALLRCLGGFGGGLGVTPPRRSRALCGGCGGVLGGQSVQYAAAVFRIAARCASSASCLAATFRA